jgi:hypothetical protein
VVPEERHCRRRGDSDRAGLGRRGVARHRDGHAVPHRFRRVTDRAGHPLTVTVTLGNPDGQLASDYFYSHPDGTYRVKGEGDRPYVLAFYDSVSGDEEFYRDVDLIADAQVLALGHETQLTGLDQHMSPGGPTTPPPASPATPATPPTPATPVVPTVRAKPKVLAPRTGHRARVRLVVRVSGPSGPVTDGIVRVSENGERIAVTVTHAGKAVAMLSRVPAGRHTYLVEYLGGTAGETSASRHVTVKVRRPHSAS